MRRLLLIAGGAVTLALLVVVAFVALFDINSCKPAIEAAVSRGAGMEFAIKGRIGLTWWPPLGVVLEGVQFRNQGDAFVEIDAIRLSPLRLVPLLRRRVSVSSCELVGLAVKIVKDTNGRFNYERAPGQAAVVAADDSVSPVLRADHLVVRGARYGYVDQRSSERTEVSGIDADLRDFAIMSGTDRLLNAFAFAGDIACGEVRRGPLTFANVHSPITARQGLFTLGTVTVDLFGGKGAGAVVADVRQREPGYEITLEVPRCRVERLLEGLGKKKSLGGDVALAVHVRASGRNERDLTRSLSGEVSLSGNNLVAEGMDVDQFIARFEKTRHFSLIDLGAFFIAGPLGTAATKGYEFARVMEGPAGRGTLARLVTTWKIRSGMAEAQDCAFATKQNRVALTGKIDLLQQSYQDAVVAVIDERGCARFGQRLSGPVADPHLSTISKMQRLAGPFVGLFEKARHVAAPNAKCEVVYSGTVPHPRIQAER